MNKLHFLFWMLVIMLLGGITETALMQSDEDFPLATHGTYVAGIRTLEFTDEVRDGRVITISLWYPAIMPADKMKNLPILQDAHMALKDLALDASGAPYPVVLYSQAYNGNRDEFAAVLEPLVTHGFVVATVTHVDETSARTLVDRPMDIRFVLDQLETLNISGEFAGMMTLDKVGLIGFSDGGYTALTMTGARIDEALISQWGTGTRSADDTTDPRALYRDWNWDMLRAYYDRFLPPAEDGLLPALGDSRIGAIVPYEPCNSAIFGERGLAAATVPTLFIAGSMDQDCPYERDAVFDDAHLGSSSHYLLSLVGLSHAPPILNYEAPVTHLTAAFFRTFLQGNADDAAYLTADFVDQFEQLRWGAVTP